jgi:hypothetical protein
MNKEREIKHPVDPTTLSFGIAVTDDGTIPTSSTKVRNQRESSDNGRRANENTSANRKIL